MSTVASAPARDTRERILDAAERLFAAHGFSGTSVRDITDAAGANLGAINYHFRSKEELYAEVFARRAALLREPILEAARRASREARRNPQRAFRALGRAFLASHEDREASLRMFGLFAREVVDHRLPHRHLMREFVLPTIDAIAGVTRQARPDLPEDTAQACAHAFFAQLMHVAKGAGASTGSVDARLEHAVRFTVAAVMHLAVVHPAHPGRLPRRKRT